MHLRFVFVFTKFFGYVFFIERIPAYNAQLYQALAHQAHQNYSGNRFLHGCKIITVSS